MLLTLDPESAEPKSRQLLRGLVALLEQGSLAPGTRLPSTREMAAQVGVHRDTVGLVYRELWAQGWLDTRPGARPVVRARLQPVGQRGRVPPPSTNPRRPVRREVLQLSTLDGDPALMPVGAFQRALQRVLRHRGAELLGYGPPQGLLELRTWIARRLETHGIGVPPDEILVTAGAQQALDLVFRALGPGKRVVVETPTYNLVLPLLKLNGLEAVPAPMGPEGLDLEALAPLLARADLLYTMPSFQNPTGRSTSRAHRERLLALCSAHGVTLLEDAFEEEMKYFGAGVQPVKALDAEGCVAYVGTFSKVLMPGLRLGWIAARPELIARLGQIRRVTDLGPPPLLQAALARFCEEGHFEVHLARMHRAFRRRMNLALRTLKETVDRAWATWEDPHGGYLIWMCLHDPQQGRPDWARLLSRHGVEGLWGEACFPHRPDGTWLRLSISRVSEAELAEGLRRIAAALREAHS